MQGRERDVAIFSYVRESKYKGIGFVSDSQRMNAGNTRARSSVWVVGSASTLRKDKHWKNLIESAEKKNALYKAFDIIILDLPGLLFFSTYTLLILFWAEIYHQARILPIDKLRPVYFIINAFIYFIQVCIWTYMRISRSAVAFELAKLFFAVMSLCAALGFVVYGGRLFIMLRKFPIESRGRQKKLHENFVARLKLLCIWKVGFVTGIHCTCFLIRCLMATVSAFDEDADYDVLNHPIVDLIYYTKVEILPSALVLFILRKLPSKRVSDQYHPIR